MSTRAWLRSSTPWPAIGGPPAAAGSGLRERVGTDRVDLSEPSARRRALPQLLEAGPADLVAAAITLPQLRTEWPQLELTEMLRDAWEDAYPALADDIGVTDHQSRSANAAR
jgi:hypothetical protein